MGNCLGGMFCRGNYLPGVTAAASVKTIAKFAAKLRRLVRRQTTDAHSSPMPARKNLDVEAILLRLAARKDGQVVLAPRFYDAVLQSDDTGLDLASEGVSTAFGTWKYELTDETLTLPDGMTLHRIRAQRDFGEGPACVRKGDLGRFVQSESNLSHNEYC